MEQDDGQMIISDNLTQGACTWPKLYHIYLLENFKFDLKAIKTKIFGTK